MKRLLILSLLALCIIAFPHLDMADDSEIIETSQITVRFDPGLQKIAREVLRIYPSVKQDIEDTFSTEIDFAPTVLLLSDRRAFQRIAGSAPVVALASGSDNLIIIDNTRMKTYPFTLRVTLKHELCHLFLHAYTGGIGLPRWLNEGIAQWASDGIAEIVVGDDRDILKKAVLSGSTIPIRDLTDGFPPEGQLLRLSYDESKSIVEYMIQQYGIERLISILNQLRQGEELDNSVMKELSITLDDLEQQWLDHLRTRITWFTYFSSHLYDILFAIAALFLTYGFIRFLIIKKAYKDEDERDERD